MIIWINFLHLYQPVNTDAHVIKEATEQSYYRIIRAIEEYPNIKFTLNITGCLFLRWEELGYYDLIKRIGKLIKKGKIELTGTAAYHPIMPLIPEQEAIKQIKENEKILKKHFGKNFKPKGFFLPELAYSPFVAKIVKKMGYQWLILDEIAYSGKIGKNDFNQVYKDKNSDLKVVIRSRKYSNSYVPETIAKEIKNNKEEKIIITATDGELYGLRYIDHTAIFEKLLKRQDLRTITISEFIKQHKKKIVNIKPLPHSWATSEKELQKAQYFNLWQEKTNVIQKKLWQLAYLAHDTVEKYKKDNNYYWARWHLVRGLASCTFWWASAKDFRLFGPISWSPDEIERGVNELIRSIRSLDDVAARKTKISAEKLCISIKRAVWKKHWTYYWKK
ncbi:MAG: polysaccharide deacetylase family protein [Patescibacteria group bacterium]|nr:polysaccharide deacetylase family protein [Patescibacteria group bacterium]